MRLLHPALWMLVRLRHRARLRRILNDLKSVRGASMYLFGLGIVASVVVAFLRGDAVQTPPGSESLARIYQSGLLTMVLIGQIKAVGDRAIYFSPSEVDFLFPAPFQRRELLAYRVISSLNGILITALAFSVLFTPFAHSWPMILIGTFLALLMVNLLTTCLAVIRETLEERAFSVGRRAALFAVLAVVAASIGYGLQAEASQGPVAVLRVTYSTWGMQLLLAPFFPFAALALSSGLAPATVGWILACLLINAVLFAALLRLDANYFETATEVSRRLYSRLQRLRAGRLRIAAQSVRFRLPPPPLLKGIGIIAWWQLTTAFRGIQALAELALLVLVVSGVVYVTTTAGGPQGADDLALLVHLAFWTTVIISYLLRFDFRAGVENLPFLKTLPLTGWAICAGQLTAPVVITTLFQLVFAAVPLRSGNYLPLMVTALFGPLWNTIWYAMENISFLLYPIGLGGRGPGDFQFIGRQMLLLVAKLAVLALNALFIAAVVVGLARLGVHELSWIGTAVWLTLALSAMSTIWLLSRVFRWFDPSRHTAAD